MVGKISNRNGILCGFFVFFLFMAVSVVFDEDNVHFGLLPSAIAADDTTVEDFDDDIKIDGADEDFYETGVRDPLEPLNRLFFHFNDKLYFWALKPVSRVYGAAIPSDFRICIRNAFRNIAAPIRIVNNTLQGKFKNAGIELSRFLINSTIGFAGLADTAKLEFGLEAKDEDLGQTLGYYGIGNGIYFCWPIFGPSSLRDTVGLVGDSFLNPINYLTEEEYETEIAAFTLKSINSTSLVIGDYEAFKESSFDPYISLRDAYIQHRQSKIRDSKVQDSVY